MIDRLELRIPQRTDFQPAFSEQYREIRRLTNDPFRSNRLYHTAGDLRPFGYPVILQMHSRFGKRGDHKIELVDAGDRSLPSMLQTVRDIFDVDSSRLEVMRIDLAADVEGVPVSWFDEHVRVMHKRTARERGRLPYEVIAKRQRETLTFGARPNVFRIYDKIEEYRHQYAERQRREAAVPAFEELFGVPEQGLVLTRVERQIAGPQAKRQIGAVKNLWRLPDFDPFRALSFVGTGKAQLDPMAYPVNTYLKGLGLHSLIRRVGLNQAKRFLNRERNVCFR